MKLRGLMLMLTMCFSVHGFANHILGGNLTFDCLGGNQYGITLTIYKDCFGATPATIDETIFFFPSGGACTTFPFSADAPFVSEVEISDLCPSELINSSCNGGLTPGTQQLTYYVEVTLDPGCTWSVEWSAGDWNYFVNLDTSLLPNAYFQTTIDPSAGCDDSVQISSLQVQYYCVGDAVNQFITVDNPNGYVLDYSLTSVLTDFGLPAIYEGGFSAANPIPGLTLDSASGLISFNAPFQFGNYVVAVQIDMYDGGVLVGSLVETMAFVIQLCPVTTTDFVPNGIDTNNATSLLVNPTTVSVCAGEQVCFTVSAENSNNQRIITLTSDFLAQFPSGTFVQTGDNPAVGECCVQTDESMIGTYTIHFEADDDDCDFPGHDELDITLIIEENLAVSATNATICFGDQVAIDATGAAAYNWNVVSGDTDPDFTCANCGNQVLAPEATTVIEVVAVGAPLTCNYRDTVTVNVHLDQLTALLTNESCNQNDGAIDLTVGGAGPFSYNWDIPFAGQDPAALDGGVHCVVVTDLSLPGCTRDTCFTLSTAPAPSGAISGSITICEGQSADILFDLTGTGPFAINMTPAGPATAIDNDIFTVTPATTTTYTLNSITDSNIPSCTYSVPSSVTVTVLPLIQASFTGISPICQGDNLALTLNVSQPGAYLIDYSINSIPQPQFSGTDGDILNFSPADDATYTVTSVQYAGLPSCVNLLNNNFDVVVNDDPDAVLTGGDEICAGDGLDLTVTLSGTGPWTVDYTANGVAQPPLAIAVSPFTWTQSPAVTTEYCLTSVTDNGVFCTHPINSCQTITVEPVPAVTFSTDQTICLGDNANLVLDLTSSPGLFNATIDVTNGGGTSTVVLSNLIDPYNYVVAPTENTSYTLTAIEYAANPGDCVVNPGTVVTVDIATDIAAELVDTLCTSNGQDYQVIIELSGGDAATYAALAAGAAPGVFAGNTYTSGLIPSGTSASWTFSDQYNCNTINVAIDDYTCPIVTWSGTMEQDTLVICGNNPVIAEFNNDAVFDGDDQQMFVLHTNSGNSLGTIIAIDCDDLAFNDGDTPLVFGAGPGQIQYGTVYYVSSVVGDDDGSGDCVNTLAPAVSVSFGQPVVWYDFPTANISGGGAVCVGDSADMEIDFTGQSPWEFQIAVDGTPQSLVTTSTDPFQFSSSTAGTYTLLSVSTAGCGGAIGGAANVIVYPLPTASIQTGGATCEGTAFVFDVDLTGNAPWTFDVSFDDGLNPLTVDSYAGIATSPATFTGLDAGTYTVSSVTDGNGCISAGASAPVNLSVNPLPAAAFAFNDTSFCQGTTLDLLVDLSGTPLWTIDYTVDGGAVQQWTSALTPLSQTTNIPGTYEIVSVTDGNGCVTLPGTSILVVEIPTPVADAGPDLEVCSATDITIGTVAVAGQTYSWNPAAGLDDSLVAQPVANVSNNSGADIVFNYEVTASTAQCNAVDQMNLTVHFVPLVDAGTADSLCFGDNMMLSATGAATYLWEDNGYFNDPLDSQAPVVAPTASSWFVVTGFDALLCSAMDSVFIEVPEQLVVEEDYTASVCFGFCDGTIDLVATGGFEPYTVQWTGGLPANFNLTNLCPGTFDYVVTDDFGCEETGTIAITEWGINFVDDVIVSNPLCYGDNNGAIEVIEPGALSYAIIETAETNTTGVFDTLAAGGYSIQIIDANGCAADTVVSLVELSSEILLDPAFDDIQVCYQDVVDFSGSAAGGFGLLTYTWYNCPELVAACELGTGSPYTVVITQDTTLYCVATDVNGCVSNVAALSAHFNAPIVLSLDPSGSASVCEFDCINLEVGATGGDGSVDVSWFVIDSGAIVEVDDSYTTSQCPLVNTMYYVTGDDGCNPTVTDSVYVTVLDTPEAIIDVIGGEGCYPLTVEFVNLTEAELADSCVWDMDDGNTQPICSGFEYTYADEGVYYPWISVTSPDGCTDLDTLDVPIIVHGYPTADFTWEPQPVTVLENQVYFFDQSEGAVEWDWDFAGLGSSVFPNPPFLFPDIDLASYQVCLEVTNEFGCTHDVCKEIFMNSILQVWVPNAFTPDNDGRNDYFLPIVNGADPEDYKLLIFDRWGIEIFESEKIDEAWIGDVLGGDYYAQDGVYIWRIELKKLSDGEEKVFTGHVTLIR